ncbi:MAG: phosphotransferase [Pseudomonadota bacterium]
MTNSDDTRLSLLHDWLKENFGNLEYTLKPVSGDASFRRYFRFKSDQHQLIAVDSPPDKESNEAFVHVTHLLAAEGVAVPHIHYCSLDFGFFLLSDFGDRLLLDSLNDKNANDLYAMALDSLITIQQTPAESLSLYDQTLLQQEMELFREWFIKKHLKINLNHDENEHLNTVFQILADDALQQPQVFVHRDYHSRNIMTIENETLGIIDYQDSVKGPITYDLVSLLRDCYISWPDEKVYALCLSFYEMLKTQGAVQHIDESTFIKFFDLMGIQRHLKAVGIFSRLNIRDNKSNYLNDIPRTLNYIRLIAKKYTETEKLAEIISSRVNI